VWPLQSGEGGRNPHPDAGAMSRGIVLLAVAALACHGPEGPAGPAGPRGSDGGAALVVTANGTGSLVADSTLFTYALVPGLAASITVPPGSTYRMLAETDGGIQVNSAEPSATCFIDVGIFVDGAQVGSARRVPAANGVDILYSVSSYGLSVETSLAAGTHAVAVMARKYFATFTECYVSSAASGSTLPGHPQLQGALHIVGFP
jgi:hypothetical protein